MAQTIVRSALRPRWHDERTYVAFGDMLGFAALVEGGGRIEEDSLFDSHRRWYEMWAHTHHRRHGRAGTPPPPAWARPKALWGRRRAAEVERRFILFNQILTSMLEKYSFPTQMTAIAFSDSFFLATNGMQEMLAFCTGLMITLISNGIPMRMGIARGSFCVHGNSQSTTAMRRVNVVQFLGSGVVRAHKAESSGLKGLRIGLHRSLLTRGPALGTEIALPLPREQRQACCKHELNYLFPLFLGPEPTVVQEQVIESVTAMRNGLGPGSKHTLHYDQTLTALSAMKRSGRGRFRGAL